MKYIAYYRVSTVKQGVSGLGLEAQRATIEAHVMRSNGVIVSEYQDICSGRNNERIALMGALRECRLTGSTLIIAKLDRLSRDRSFLMTLADSKLNFVCCDMPQANELTIGIIAVMADYESKLISQRTKAALQAAKAKGKVLGNPNLSLIRNSDTTKARLAHVQQSVNRNDEIKEIINELIVKLGEQSTRSLAKLLNDAGYKTARGNEFSSGQISRLMK